jgi:hypothetical protein
MSGGWAVFLYSAGWRTAGTWLWSRLRLLAGARGFYEPLHEDLLTLTQEGIAERRPEGWESGHPDMAPYFEEFAPFLRPSGGVAGYLPGFAIDRGMDPDPLPLIAYLGGLIAAARSEGRVAVFKFCRASLRFPLLRAAFPEALHLAVDRNPLTQFASAWQQWVRHRNPYFLTSPLLVLVRNREQAKTRLWLEALRLDLPAFAPEVVATLPEAREWIAATPAPECYRLFLAHWLLVHHVLAEAGAEILATELLAVREDRRAQLGRRLHRASGLTPDFGGMRLPDRLGPPRPLTNSSASMNPRCGRSMTRPRRPSSAISRALPTPFWPASAGERRSCGRSRAAGMRARWPPSARRWRVSRSGWPGRGFAPGSALPGLPSLLPRRRRGYLRRGVRRRQLQAVPRLLPILSPAPPCQRRRAKAATAKPTAHAMSARTIPLPSPMRRARSSAESPAR